MILTFILTHLTLALLAAAVVTCAAAWRHRNGGYLLGAAVFVVAAFIGHWPVAR